MTKESLAAESADRIGVLSWTERFYRSVPVSPIWVGLGIVVGLLVVLLAIA
jgi:hypothetical protein